MLRKFFTQIAKIEAALSRIESRFNNIQIALGRIEGRQLFSNSQAAGPVKNFEFQVFSQWGEDGIIQFLLSQIDISNRIFIEFGVETYSESNSRFLLVNNNWSGLIIDSEKNYIDKIKTDPIYWKYNLKAVHSFITKENINRLIEENGIKGEIGLLSIDIDGNDYWVWKAIDVVNPAIVIVEYNSRFGTEQAVTIPYDKNFIRSTAHYSWIYYGASLKALWQLAESKGYAFVGCNSAGNNAFFVRKELKPESIKELPIEEGYVQCKFREARNKEGELIFLSPQEEKDLLSTLPVVEV